MPRTTPTGSAATECPRCGFSAGEPFAECSRCGVVVAKYLTRLASRPLSLGESPAATARPGGGSAAPRLESEDRRALLTGVVIGALLFVMPLTRLLLGQFLSTLVHELGHALAYWGFGHLAIPSFDFLHGGGVTVSFGQLRLVPVGLAALALGWALRSGVGARLRTLVVVAALVYLALALTEAHLIVVGLMGLGGEAIFTGLFLYRALGGRPARRSLERPAYAAAATFLSLQLATFAFNLLTNATFQRWYLAGKGGLRGDLDAVARELGLSFPTVSLLFFPVAISPALVAWLVWLNQEELRRRVRRFFELEL